MISFVFENEHLVAVDKPGGWLSVPSQWGKEDPRPVVSIELAKQLGMNVLPVHRLDLEVTGIMLFAKDQKIHQVANKWFEARTITKIYEAWTEGAAPEAAVSGQLIEWSSTLHRGKKRSFVSPHGKLAVTRAYWMETLDTEEFGPVQRWLLEPLTGRPHQLRVELSRHGFPILGDALYGAQKKFRPSMMALRAVKLDFSECRDAANWKIPSVITAPPLKDVLKDFATAGPASVESRENDTSVDYPH